MQTNSTTFQVDGYEVSASFADKRNTVIYGHLKQILLASFASHIPTTRPGDILAVAPDRRYNKDGGRNHAP